MRSIYFLGWALCLLIFLYLAVFNEPTSENIQAMMFFGFLYAINYLDWKEEEREEEFNRRVVEEGRKLREEMKGKIQRYEKIIEKLSENNNNGYGKDNQ